MSSTRPHNGATGTVETVLADRLAGRPDHRRARSRAPAISTVIGAVLGTLVADVVLLSVLGGSLLGAARTVGPLGDPGSWLAAFAALREPTVALASLAVGGLPGALLGHSLAARRLRRDRLDGLMRSDGRTA